MQGDIRPVRTGNTRHISRTSFDYNRPIPKVTRQATVRSVDGFTLRPVIPISTGQRTHSPAPQAALYHTAKTASTAPERVEYVASTKQWLRKARRRSLVKRFKHIARGPSFVYAASLVVFIAGMGIVVQGALLNNQVHQQTQVLSANTKDSGDSATTQRGNEAPSEEKPKANYLQTYKVSPDLPRLISIPKIQEKARVLQVGVDSANQLLTPKNIYDTAWYTGSSKPGEMGASVIDGHYVGPTTNGVFSKLNHLAAGDSIVVERGDGKQLTFVVASVKTVAATSVDMSELLVSVDTAKPGLSLITCGGKYNEKTFEFADRTVVRAVLGGIK